MKTPATPPTRLTSLDQFRGYTMLGMLLVNFLGDYAVCPRILQHKNDYCSYADTIMPHFLFAAGFALRLSLGRRRESTGKMPWGRAIQRILGLTLIAIVWYIICDLGDVIAHFQTESWGDLLLYLCKGVVFQTLLHIAATSLWILPVVTAPWKTRLCYIFASGILHVGISWWFNFEWIHTPPAAIDGGPFGFLSWAIPALCGTLACDAVRAAGPAAAVRIALSGLGVMLLGWIMSMPTVLYNVRPDQMATHPAPQKQPAAPNSKPSNDKIAPDPVIPTRDRIRAWDGSIVELPFISPPSAAHRQWNYWMMSQQTGNLSYLTFSAGVSLVIYALFLWFCDRKGFRLGLFQTLGTNSLAAYLLHSIAIWIGQGVANLQLWPYFDKKSPSVGLTLVCFACVTLFVYAGCRLLERRNWYLRV